MNQLFAVVSILNGLDLKLESKFKWLLKEVNTSVLD